MFFLYIIITVLDSEIEQQKGKKGTDSTLVYALWGVLDLDLALAIARSAGGSVSIMPWTELPYSESYEISDITQGMRITLINEGLLVTYTKQLHTVTTISWCCSSQSSTCYHKHSLLQRAKQKPQLVYTINRCLTHSIECQYKVNHHLQKLKN